MFFFFIPYFSGLVYLKKTFEPVFLIASILVMISWNIHNDYCEKTYRGYSRRHLLLLILFSFIFGTLLFPNAVMLTASAITFFYNWKLKHHPLLSFTIGITWAVTPLLIIGSEDLLLLAAGALFGLSIQGTHQLFDGDALSKVRNAALMVSFINVVAAIVNAILVYRLETLSAYIPKIVSVVVAPLGFIALAVYNYSFRNKFGFGKPLHEKERDFWILLGNLILLSTIGWYIALA